MKIIETVRDGFQGLTQFVPTQTKIDYINALLKVGFDAVDVGSFVSPKAIPQMADTAEVIKGLDLSGTRSKLMALAANKKGAERAVQFKEVDQIIYPFSISPTFLQKNINADCEEADRRVDEIVEVCEKNGREAIIYMSMAFGNPYGDMWNMDIICHWVDRLIQKGVKIIPLSDITGESTPDIISRVYEALIIKYPEIEFRLHLHARLDDWIEKVDAAYQAGCRWFDTVLGGMGGCPMTGYELLSNLDTQNLISYLDKNNINHGLDKDVLIEANKIISRI